MLSLSNMGTRTTRSQIKNALRRLWLYSVERRTTLKNSNYCCEQCQVKMSRAKGYEQKIEVHHKQGVGNWDEVIDVIMKELLPDPSMLQSLCPACHDKITYNQDNA